MERRFLVPPQDILPQARPIERLLVSPDAEPVAGVKHDAHRLGDGRHKKPVHLGLRRAGKPQTGHLVLPLRLGFLHLDLQVEPPEGVARIRIQTDSLNLFSGAVVASVTTITTSLAINQRRDDRLRAASSDRNDQNAPDPRVAIHATVVELRTASNFLAVGW